MGDEGVKQRISVFVCWCRGYHVTVILRRIQFPLESSFYGYNVIERTCACGAVSYIDQNLYEEKWV